MEQLNQQEQNYDQPLITTSTPLEYLQGQLPRQAITILILGLISLITPIGLLGIQLFILGLDFMEVLPGIGYLIMGIVFSSISIIIFKAVIKKGDIVLIKHVRGGLTLFDKIKYGKPILFNRNDPSTKLTIIWSGAGTAIDSGAKVLSIKEGNASNENINLCVAETDWNKNLSSMVKAKTYADLAESELLENKGLFGLKWQDLALIGIILLTIIAIGINIGLLPDQITKSIVEALNDGVLQRAIQSVVTSTPKVV
jgi:hypothetical protein